MTKSFLACSTLAFLLLSVSCKQTASVEQQAKSDAPETVVKDASDAYLYLYPLVVFGVSYEALTNVDKPT